MRHVTTIALALAVSLGVASAATAHPADKAAKAQAVINAYIDTHPQMIVDFADVSGESPLDRPRAGGGRPAVPRGEEVSS